MVADSAAVLATCHGPRPRGRGVESDEVALKHGWLYAVIAGLLFMAGMQRSEVSALAGGDVAEAAAGDGEFGAGRRTRRARPGTCGS